MSISMSMSEYRRSAELLMTPQTPRERWAGLFRDAGSALLDMMTAPNDSTVFEPVKRLGSLLVATQTARTLIYRGHELVARPGDAYLQFGIFPGVEIDVNDRAICGAMTDAARYVRRHGLEERHPHIIGYTHELHARAATRAGFSASPVRPDSLGAITLAIEREYASFTPEGRDGELMGPVYIAEQPTVEFTARYLRSAAS